MRTKICCPKCHSRFVGKTVIIRNQTGEIVKKFNTVLEASKEFNVTSCTITFYCKNNKIYKGYKWELLDNLYQNKV